MSTHKILFTGCGRNCDKHLSAVLKNIDNLSEIISEAAFLFVENDSSDQTLKQLDDFCLARPRARVLRLEGIARDIKQRTIRLAVARNAIVATARTWADIANYSHVMVLDLDDINSTPWDLAVIKESIDWMDTQDHVAGIFPNQNGPYYDLWALRDEGRCPNDIWEEVLNQAVAKNQSDTDAAKYIFEKRAFTLPHDAPAWHVESAFGGFGIYKLAPFLSNQAPYCGESVVVWGEGRQTKISRWQRCEHVNFNMGLRRQGHELVVLPKMINADTSDWGYEPSAFRTMLF